MKIIEKTFGILSNGKKVHLYTLKAGDLKLCLCDYGATWTSLTLPSQKGIKNDILLGFTDFGGYLQNNPYMGVTVGRYANRIKRGNFSIDGKTYQLDINNGDNTLHGGNRGFDKILWKSEAYEKGDGIFVRFELDSPDGDCGFPGNVKAVVSYGLTKSNELIAVYEAKADELTPINLTNHSYFNLAGEGSGLIFSHELCLHSSSYVEIDEELIPTGHLIPVLDSAFDFRKSKPIGRDLDDKLTGYDHCFTVDGDPGKLRPCAEVYEAKSGRTMRVFTTQPGIQFYTGNMLKGLPGKSGSIYTKHTGFCLETQHFPDSPNQNNFIPAIFGPGENYHEKTVFSFEIK